jgi:hypothetical protein
MSDLLDGPTPHDDHRRRTDLTRGLRADILTQDDCWHEPEKGRETSRMDPNVCIVLIQLVRDYPGLTQGMTFVIFCISAQALLNFIQEAVATTTGRVREEPRS